MYRVIFMDYSMPECDGCESTRQIRRYLDENCLSQPYICCLTAYTEDSYRKTSKDAGMDTLLIKPILQGAAELILAEGGLLKDK